MTTERKITVLSNGNEFEEITNIHRKLISSVLELDSDSKLIAPKSYSTEVNADYVQLNVNLAENPTTVGAVYWDNDDQTLTAVMPPSNGSSVRLQIGQEMYIRAVNKTGTTISNGEVVFVDGAQGNRPSIALADADNYENATRVIGMATEDIGKNLYGYITTTGLVRDLNTSDYSEGDCLYLSSTAGAYTTVTPTEGKARIRIGMVAKSHVTDGWICVRVQEDKYMFGSVDEGSYSYFEKETGVLVAQGSAITYRDEYASGVYFVPLGATAPDEVNVTIGGVVTKKYAFDGLTIEEKLGNTFEIAHDIAIDQVNAGTKNITFHIHSAPSNATSTGDSKFLVDWALLKAQGAVITGTQISITTTMPSNSQYSNRIVGSVLPVPSEGFDIGDLIEFTISRNPADSADTYPADTIFYKAALHVPCDTNGSRGVFTK